MCGTNKLRLLRIEATSEMKRRERGREREEKDSEKRQREGRQKGGEEAEREGRSGAPQDNNIMLWNAVIFG